MALNKTSDEPGETSPGMQSAMLKAIQRTSNALEEALNRLSHSRSSEPPSVVPPVVLKLEDYLPEGPEYLVQRLEEYFTEPSNSQPTWVGPVRVIVDARDNCYWVERGAYATLTTCGRRPPDTRSNGEVSNFTQRAEGQTKMRPILLTKAKMKHHP
jgi:hypothetical protein